MPLTPLGHYARFTRRYLRNALVDHREQWFRRIAPAPHRPRPETWADDRLTVAWLGHATVLINLFGTWVLTDPVLGSRIGVRFAGATLGPRRLIRPALLARDLPRVDLVLLSHAHMDHLDLGTLGRLPRDTHVVVAQGNRDLLSRFSRVDELAWGDGLQLGELRIEATPARHWGARKVTDRNRGYGGFLIQKGGRSVLYAGDTAYTDLLTPLGRRERIDLAILPIGAYDPWIDHHASPEEAWAMARDMGAEYVLPVHHSTFRLSREPMDEPIRRFLAVAGEARWRVVATEVGETVVLQAT